MCLQTTHRIVHIHNDDVKWMHFIRNISPCNCENRCDYFHRRTTTDDLMTRVFFLCRCRRRAWKCKAVSAAHSFPFLSFPETTRADRQGGRWSNECGYRELGSSNVMRWINHWSAKLAIPIRAVHGLHQKRNRKSVFCHTSTVNSETSSSPAQTLFAVKCQKCEIKSIVHTRAASVRFAGSEAD